ncbi:MAG: 5'-methylthioadenosine/adenosylhomocysteine nucleosidase [Longibaculum sp.]
MIGIIGAMAEEVEEIKKLMSIEEQKEIQDYLFYVGKMNQKDVVLLQGGIGKVNAAVATTLLLSHYDIDCVINIGSAGGLSLEQNVGDVVISSEVVHYDVDVTAFQRELGEVPGMPRFFVPDQDLLKRVKDILSQLHMVSHIGLIASGDQFVSREDQVQKIKHDFPQAMCVEMEAAAIAQVCYVFHKKFIITRSLSDIFNKGENHIQFDEYLKKASQASAKMCYELVSTL